MVTNYLIKRLNVWIGPITFKAKKNVTKLIKKLKKGTYKVQVRAMITSGKLKAYSAWAKAKKVKVK